MSKRERKSIRERKKKETLMMWIIIINVMIAIFFLWIFSLRHQFVFREPKLNLEEKKELKEIKEEFSQIFSEVKRFKFEELLSILEKETKTRKKEEIDKLDESEIEELRRKIFSGVVK